MKRTNTTTNIQHIAHISPILFIYRRNLYHTPFPSNIPYIPILQKKLLQQHHIPTPISPPPKKKQKKNKQLQIKRAPRPHFFSTSEETFLPKRPRASSHGSIQNGSFYEVEEQQNVKTISSSTTSSTTTNVNQNKTTTTSPPSKPPTSTFKNIVSLNYNNLLKEDPTIISKIGEAFGYNGIGILAVQDVPNLQELRTKLLSTGRHFAEDLSPSTRAKYEHPKSYWSFGWSHGKEKLQGRPDYSKGSYYNNPVENVPYTDKKIVQQWPSFAHPNIWPSKEDEPELEFLFINIEKLIFKTCLKLGT